MATRFYLQSTGTPAISPTFEADWDITASAVRRTAKTTKQATAATTFGAAEAVTTNLVDVLVAQFVSDPLDAGNAFATTDTIKGVIRALESLAGANDFAQLLVKVVDSTGTLQSVILASGAGSLTNEFTNTSPGQARKFPVNWTSPGTALSANYTTVAGDRLVFEVGYRAQNVSSTSATGTLTFGDVSATDLPENETDTSTDNPWIELSPTLTFASGTVSLSRSCADTVTASDAAGRILSRSLAVSDTVTATDSPSRTTSAARAATDTIATSEALTRGALGMTRALTDVASVTDTPARTVSTTRAATEALTTTEAATASAGKSRVATDAVGVSDTTAAGAIGRSRSATDTVAVSDTTSRGALTFTRITTDTLATSDTATGTAQQSLTRTVSDTITIGDSVVLGSVSRTRTATEAVAVSDQTSRAVLGFTRTAVDAITLADVAQPAGAPARRPYHLTGTTTHHVASVAAFHRMTTSPFTHAPATPAHTDPAAPYHVEIT